MSERLKSLERKWQKSQSDEDQFNYLREKLRLGLINPTLLDGLAELGCDLAQKLGGVVQNKRSSLSSLLEFSGIVEPPEFGFLRTLKDRDLVTRIILIFWIEWNEISKIHKNLHYFWISPLNFIAGILICNNDHLEIAKQLLKTSMFTHFEKPCAEYHFSYDTQLEIPNCKCQLSIFCLGRIEKRSRQILEGLIPSRFSKAHSLFFTVLRQSFSSAILGIYKIPTIHRDRPAISPKPVHPLG